MTKRIRAAFMDNLKNANWMDQSTKSGAREKVRLLAIHQSVPPSHACTSVQSLIRSSIPPSVPLSIHGSMTVTKQSWYNISLTRYLKTKTFKAQVLTQEVGHPSWFNDTKRLDVDWAKVSTMATVSPTMLLTALTTNVTWRDRKFYNYLTVQLTYRIPVHMIRWTKREETSVWFTPSCWVILFQLKVTDKLFENLRDAKKVKTWQNLRQVDKPVDVTLWVP